MNAPGKAALMLIFGFGLLFSSCRREVLVNEIPGVYKVTYSFGEETLQLKTNGEFTQTIKVSTEAGPIGANGTWTYYKGEKEIHLENRMMLHDGCGKFDPNFKLPNRGVSVLAVKNDFRGGVVIISSADGSGFDYHREEIKR